MSTLSMFFEKPELKLAVLDEIMFNNKRFQTKKDWEIETNARSARYNSYYAAFGTYWASWVLSAPSGQVKRIFGPPDSLVIPPWRMAKDAIMNTVLGLNGVRPQATGFYRQAWAFGPSFALVAAWNHYIEAERFNSYLALKDETVFGELADTIHQGKSFAGAGSLDQVWPRSIYAYVLPRICLTYTYTHRRPPTSCAPRTTRPP